MKILIQSIEQLTTQNGKLYTKIRDSQGNLYGCWDANVANQLKQGQVFDVVTKTVQGKDGNNYINITGLNQEKSPVNQPNVKNGTYKRDPKESQLIIRQSCLKAAVDLVAAPGAPQCNDQLVLEIADKFVDWVNGVKKTSSNPTEQLPIIDVNDEMDVSNIQF